MSGLSSSVVVTAVLNGPLAPEAPRRHDELAALARRAERAGAAIVQIHVRDEETGLPSTDLAVARHVTAQEIAKLSGVLVEPSMRAAGGGELIAEELVEAHVRLAALDPLVDACIDGLRVPRPEGSRRITAMMRAAGVKAVFEIGSRAALAAALELLAEGPIGGPPVFSFDVPRLFGLDELPSPAVVETRRPEQFLETLERGGHLLVRLDGLEKAVQLARATGREPAVADDAARLWEIPEERRASRVRVIATGRHSGAPRPAELTYRTLDKDRLVLVGSGAGSPNHPDWALNLRANPEVTVERDGREERRVARWTAGDERERLWKWIVSQDRGQLYYERKAQREFPVIVLEHPPGRGD